MTELKENGLQTDFGYIVYDSFECEGVNRFNVFIHGLGGNRKWFFSDFETFELDKYSWIVPDLMGHGDSSKRRNAELYTMDQQAEFILEILDYDEVKEITILAHSMGGPISISLIEKLAAREEQKIKVKAIFYLEGNLDAGDAFMSSNIVTMPLEEFEVVFDSWSASLAAESQDNSLLEWVNCLREAGPYVIWQSSKDLVYLSKRGDLLDRLKAHLDFPIHFIYGAKNKGQYSSEKLVRAAGFPIHYIPDAGHAMFRDNPTAFWELVERLF